VRIRARALRAIARDHVGARCARKVSDRRRNWRSLRGKNFDDRACANRESLGTDSLVLIDSVTSRPARKPNCAKFFCAAFASHHVNSGAKFCAHARDSRARAAPMAHAGRCKKSLFHRCFCNMRAMCAQCCSAFVYYDVACAVRVVARARQAQRASRIHVVKWSQCFFHCSVVNGVQCVSIPDRTDATPAMIHG